MASFVLDTSAILAYVENEAGAGDLEEMVLYDGARWLVVPF